MSQAGNALRSRFAGLRVRVVVRELEGIVPEDSQGETAIYGQPFTLRDSKRLDGFIADDDPEGYAQVVIDKAETESGERLFDVGDKAILMNCIEAHIVSRVARSLMASVSLEDAKGNS